MTWVVGTPTMFGYGFGVSDIRVTLGDDSEVDCLQKIYAVGRYLTAGFAGSVRIGFAMIDELRMRAHLSDERLACDPEKIAQEWPQFARQVFQTFPRDEQEAHCHLLIISVHPREHTGNPCWPRSYVHIFRSPDFLPEVVPVHTLGSIGSGTHYPRCREVIERFSSDNNFRMLCARGGSTLGGMGTMIGINLTSQLLEVQPLGVSPHLHYCWVYRGNITISTNDHTQIGRWSVIPLGSENMPTQQGASQTLEDGSVLFSMPNVATSWDELERILVARGSNAVGCIA
jgi:hypothetical protein